MLTPNAAITCSAEMAEKIQKAGLKMSGKSSDGRFMEFKDKRGTTRAKIHPPDKIITQNHLHIYNDKQEKNGHNN